MVYRAQGFFTGCSFWCMGLLGSCMLVRGKAGVSVKAIARLAGTLASGAGGRFGGLFRACASNFRASVRVQRF